MNQLEATKEFAASVGKSAYVLKQLGATNEQVKNYVDFQSWSVQRNTGTREVTLYYATARKNYNADSAKEELTHPRYELHRQHLAKLIQMNGFALNWPNQKKG